LWSEFTNIENYTSSLRAAFTASGVNTIFTNDITASNIEVRNNLNVTGTLFASKVVTLIESSSIIYSSGSNILGDEVSDTQTLIGSVIMSGSASLTGSMGITGNLSVGGNGNFGGSGSFIGDLTATGNISSSTISGIGNVTAYSASVQNLIFSISSSISGTINTLSQSLDARLDVVEATASLYIPFSTSVDSRLDSLENFTSSTYNTFSASVDNRLDELENWSSSLQTDFVTTAELTTTASFLQNQINQKLFTSSFNAYTQSVNDRFAYTPTTGSNLFVGNQTITGSLILSSSAAVELSVIGNSIFSGSLRGNVVPLTIASSTASMDCSLGNFFTLTLAGGGANTRLVATNIQPGETISVRVTQNTTTGSISYPSYFKFPNFGNYSASLSPNAVDILTFITFDSTNLYGVNVKNMI